MREKLLKYIEPTMPLEEMAIMDTQTPDNKMNAEDLAIKQSEHVGRIYPFLKVDSYVFNFHDILSMELDMNDKLPKYTFTIVDGSGVFAGSHMPKSDIIASLYIKSSNDKVYNPIRNDIYITSIIPTGKTSTKGDVSEGRGNIYMVKGILFVPQLNNLAMKNALKGTSLEVLKKIAKTLKLGFVTNESSTNDSMNWLMTNSTFKDINEIVKHAYKDDNSFYTWFIDQYYCLNFINVADMLNDEEEQFDNIIPKFIGYVNDHKNPNDKTSEDNKDESNTVVVPLLLSNHSEMIGMDTFISDFKLRANQGSILNKFSYKHVLSYYDPYLDRSNLDNNFVEYGMYSYDMYKLKNEDILTTTRYSYGGVDYKNTHTNYIDANIRNAKNLLELEQINLLAQTNEMNFHIIRGMTVPVIIMKQGLETKNEDTQEVRENVKGEDFSSTEDKLQVNINNMLTGPYVVNGIKYIYKLGTDNRFFYNTYLTLCKNVWDEKYKNVVTEDV